jgi:hypothetical protein
MDMVLWDEETIIGERHANSVVSKVQVHCTEFDFWETSKVSDEEEDG